MSRASGDHEPGYRAMTPGSVEFRWTVRQRRRRTRGLIGLAAIAWSAGVVRFAVAHRLGGTRGWWALVLLAALLALTVAGLSTVRPAVVLVDDAVLVRRGPIHERVAWADVAAVEVRERGVSRRVVLVQDGRRTVLPVPLTGGSLVGPGPDPGLDEKVELIRRWWTDHRA